MIHTEKVKALAFDFGGTLDSPFMHWMKIYLKLYGEELHLPAYGREFQRLLCVCRTDDGALATGENLTFIA